MDNYLLKDLTDISISYMNTETYKKLKNIYPQEFKNSKTDELNLFCNVPYEKLLEYAKIYTNHTEHIKRYN
jgi:hypothetical protein